MYGASVINNAYLYLIFVSENFIFFSLWKAAQQDRYSFVLVTLPSDLHVLDGMGHLHDLLHKASCCQQPDLMQYL